MHLSNFFDAYVIYANADGYVFFYIYIYGALKLHWNCCCFSPGGNITHFNWKTSLPGRNFDFFFRMFTLFICNRLRKWVIFIYVRHLFCFVLFCFWFYAWLFVLLFLFFFSWEGRSVLIRNNIIDWVVCQWKKFRHGVKESLNWFSIFP